MGSKDYEILSLIGFIPIAHQAVIQERLREHMLSLSFYSLQDITAVYSKVSADKGDGEMLEKMFADLTVLMPYLRKHEETLEKIMPCSPVFPVQFGAFFTSLIMLEQQMSKHYDLINEVLLKVVNQSEWAIKGYLEQAKAIDKFSAMILQEQQEQLMNVSPGVRYLREQHSRNEVKNQLNFYLQPVCQVILARLLESTTAFSERQIIQTNSVENQSLMLNWAFLVANKKLIEFNKLLEEINNNYGEYGLHFSLTGPWPPYSFCKWENRPSACHTLAS